MTVEIKRVPRERKVKTYQELNIGDYFRQPNYPAVYKKLNPICGFNLALICNTNSVLQFSCLTQVIPCDKSGKPLQEEVKQVEFRKLKIEDWFEYNNRFYICNGYVCAVDVQTGIGREFSRDNLVTPIKVTLLVEE
jgi:hypothetical protein